MTFFQRAAQVAALALAVTAATSTAGPPALDWDRRAEVLVLEYSERSDKIAAADALRLEIWGDGRVVTTRPEPLARPGTREIHLSTEELDRFLRDFVVAELVDFDPQQVDAALADERRRLRTEAAQRGEFPALYYRSEKERVRLELHLSKFRSGSGGGSHRVDLAIAWRGLRQDLSEFPSQGELLALAKAAQACRELMERPDLSGLSEDRP